ncbi:hypothetical protein E2562_036237 [Oryza meyeriana var. granulata]|uniref:Uncharacterized protein n=1 Tax=Oryza meyeriana var. granulata TaxID=110450 RepID=A0A6G1ET73_9ORYZ|nr:hypothetical protein E2562_036237 [Oryza meyeriana var. granulata]
MGAIDGPGAFPGPARDRASTPVASSSACCAPPVGRRASGKAISPHPPLLHRRRHLSLLSGRVAPTAPPLVASASCSSSFFAKRRYVPRSLLAVRRLITRVAAPSLVRRTAFRPSFPPPGVVACRRHSCCCLQRHHCYATSSHPFSTPHLPSSRPTSRHRRLCDSVPPVNPKSVAIAVSLRLILATPSPVRLPCCLCMPRDTVITSSDILKSILLCDLWAPVFLPVYD